MVTAPRRLGSKFLIRAGIVLEYIGALAISLVINLIIGILLDLKHPVAGWFGAIAVIVELVFYLWLFRACLRWKLAGRPIRLEVDIVVEALSGEEERG